MTDETTSRSYRDGLIPPGLKRFLWPDDGRDPVARLLMMAIAVVVTGILVSIGVLAWVATHTTDAPRTATERQLLVLGRLVDKGSKEPRIWGDYLAALIDSGQYAAAGQTVSRARKATGDDPVVLVQEARLYRETGRQKEALSTIDLAITRARDKAEKAAEALRKKGVKPQPAKNEEVILASIIKAEIFEQMLRWPDAKKAYDIALDEDPLMADVLVARGGVFRALKDDAKAKADYDAALRVVPDYEPALKGIEGLKGAGDK